MIRRLAAAAVVLAALGLVAGVARAVTSSSSEKKATKITIWVGFLPSTHELKVLKRLIAEYDKKTPGVEVDVVGGIRDAKIIAAIRSGNPPDVVSSFASSNVGTFCSTGAWIDLGPLMKQSHISPNIFPKASQYYTQYNGVRCALVTMSYRRFVAPILAGLPPDMFEVVVTGDSVSQGKPHPEPYTKAAAILGVAPEDTVAIEDSNTGARSAEAAGCTVLVVENHVPVLPGDRRVLVDTLAGLTVADLPVPLPAG